MEFWINFKIKKGENFELSRITRQLKLTATDGKYYNTDVCDIESILSKNAKPIKQWIAYLSKERIEKVYLYWNMRYS